VPETSLATLGFDLVSPNGYVVALVVIGVLLAAGMIGSIAIAKDKE
jgi:NADH:ubiquinone oxidoreductase subunit 6 (subunit J)